MPYKKRKKYRRRSVKTMTDCRLQAERTRLIGLIYCQKQERKERKERKQRLKAVEAELAARGVDYW